MSEGNYSDAHGFPYAYKTLNIGKTVGMPVPGTMTAVWWERLQDPSLVFGIPQVGSKNMEGEYLENKQLEPDVKIKQEYSKVSKGIDQQLIKAIEVLMN
jgi:C-terminal processing protease CtpA/Prc